MECVVATGNAGKLREFRALLASQPVDVRSLEGLSPEQQRRRILQSSFGLMLVGTVGHGTLVYRGLEPYPEATMAILYGNESWHFDSL